MSYQVLARKWRPQKFGDMIGQDSVLRALTNALDTDRLHHAYLFTGMRGVGKTTIARILAKCLNCETNGVSASPCGECSTCRDIEAGRFLDLIEVDAASRTRVDETRELLENVPYAPASGRFKVYLIDEVHMFSTHSFNALLKTLEEPPAHVKFLLATTDPQKVPVTVLSRCLQFNLKRMAPGKLAEYLEKVLDAESITHERAAIELIARASEGSVRDALSLVEQAVAFGAGAVKSDDVESMLGRASVQRLIELLETLADGDIAAVFSQVDALAEYAPDYGQLLGELLSLLHQVAMLQNVPDAGNESLVKLASSMAPDAIQLHYQIGLHARRDLPFAPDPREAFDMALLRMHAFAPQSHPPGGSSDLDGSGHRSAEPESAKSGGAEPEVAPQPTVESAARAGTSDPAAPGRNSKKQNPQGQGELHDAATRGLPVRDMDATADARAAALAAARGELPATGSTAVQTPAAKAAPAGATPVKTSPATQVARSASKPPREEPDVALDVDGWPRWVATLDLSGMPRQLASHCRFGELNENALLLHLEAGSEHLNTQRFASRLETAISERAGRPISLRIDTVAESLETPAKLDARREAANQAAARAAIDEDPIVRKLIAEVDASVDPDSVQPLQPTTD